MNLIFYHFYPQNMHFESIKFLKSWEILLGRKFLFLGENAREIISYRDKYYNLICV